MTPFASKDILIFNSYLLMLRDLKFPTKGFGCYELGRHKWYMLDNSLSPHVKIYRWEFFHEDEYRSPFKFSYIPDIWKKVNGGWQIVY